jgi:predicted GTPase
VILFIKSMLLQKKGQYYLIATLTLLFPVAALTVMGYLYLWDKGWLLWFSLSLLGLALLTMLLHRLFFRGSLFKSNQTDEEEGTVHLEPVLDWSDRDAKIWIESLDNISRMNLPLLEWRQLPDSVLDQLAFVANQYNQNTKNARYAFTIPDILLMLEICSREYRRHVLENFPLSQSMKISTLMGLTATSTKLRDVYKRYSPALDLFRAVISGGTSVPAQVASKLGAELGRGLTNHMENNLKQLLFEQVSQVAIDLYSGRLKISDEDIANFRRSQRPPANVVTSPLSVMLVGQVNSGKSSLINALKKRCVAEVDVLPATVGFLRYELCLAEGLDMTLTDSPGLDGNEVVLSALLKEASRSDLILWVSQANQPSKALDHSLLKQWDTYFSKQLDRKKPPILLVTTHNDMLKPLHEWHPPYDLSNEKNAKVQSIVAASRFTREALGLPVDAPVVPVALRAGQEPYNIDTLCDIIVALSREARAAQLNKERLDATRASNLLSTAVTQTIGLAGEGIKLIFR